MLKIVYILIKVLHNDKDLKFKKVIIKEYKNGMVFAICYKPTWSEEVNVILLLKILYVGHMLLVILTVKKLLERVIKKNCKKQIKQNLDLKR